jgi:hypothetical protein
LTKPVPVKPAWLDSTTPCEIVAFSAWKSVVGVPPPTSKSMKSTLGPPVAVVAAARMVLVPALTGTVKFLDTQVSQVPVPGKDAPVATVVPFAEMVIGRSTVVPLANRSATVALPALAAVTVNSTKAPTALVPLQKPVPENPA